MPFHIRAAAGAPEAGIFSGCGGEGALVDASAMAKGNVMRVVFRVRPPLPLPALPMLQFMLYLACMHTMHVPPLLLAVSAASTCRLFPFTGRMSP